MTDGRRTRPTVTIGARIAPQYREQLRALATEHASTISRQAARLLMEALDAKAEEPRDVR